MDIDFKLLQRLPRGFNRQDNKSDVNHPIDIEIMEVILISHYIVTILVQKLFHH